MNNSCCYIVDVDVDDIDDEKKNDNNEYNDDIVSFNLYFVIKITK